MLSAEEALQIELTKRRFELLDLLDGFAGGFRIAFASKLEIKLGVLDAGELLLPGL